MRILVVTSLRDPAGVNIHRRLTELYGFEQTSKNPEGLPLYELENLSLTSTNRSIIMASHVESWLKVDLIVYASRHSSVAGKPCLTIHTPGNLTDKVEMGGRPREVCIAPAVAMKTTLIELYEAAKDKNLLERYDVCLECTHHGDYLKGTPCFFIEIGSGREEWMDSKAAEALAEAVVLTSKRIETALRAGFRVALGVGGPHYNARLTSVMLETDVAVGHIIPKYALSEIDGKMMARVVERTLPRPEFALLDWKGLAREKRRIVSILDEMGLDWKKIRDVKRGED